MVNQTTYKFSPAQCVHLESALTEYIACFKDEDTDGCDQTIAEVAGTICKESGIQDESKKESVNTVSLLEYIRTMLSCPDRMPLRVSVNGLPSSQTR